MNYKKEKMIKLNFLYTLYTKYIGDLVVKTLRVKDSTYALVMQFVGQLQSIKKSSVSVDYALQIVFEEKNRKKDFNAWDKFDSLQFSGPKTNCVEEIDLVQ